MHPATLTDTYKKDHGGKEQLIQASHPKEIVFKILQSSPHGYLDALWKCLKYHACSYKLILCITTRQKNLVVDPEGFQSFQITPFCILVV